MASYTTNLNLKKPAGSESVSIGDINNNMDTIDQAYGTLNGKVIPFKLSTKIGNNVSLTVPSSSRHLLQVFYGAITAYWIGFIQGTGAGQIRVAEIFKGESISMSASGSTITFSTTSASPTIEVYDTCYSGNFMTIND